MKRGVVKVVTAAARDMHIPQRPVMPLNMAFAAEVSTIVGSAIWKISSVSYCKIR